MDSIFQPAHVLTRFEIHARLYKWNLIRSVGQTGDTNSVWMEICRMVTIP